jgi:pyruvate/2-oxoglutarate/acetoin dehydrogenase E1 component
MLQSFLWKDHIKEAHKAAEELAKGISCEIIDLNRSSDGYDTILTSLLKNK